MDNNHELENQDLRPTTMQDDSALANLPGEELSEQNLDAVSGSRGTAGSIITDGLDIAEQLTEHPHPGVEETPGLTGDLMEAPVAAENAINNIFG